MAPVISSLITLFAPRSLAAGCVGTVLKRVADFHQARANRRAFAQLAGWDDHMLADIGLNRSVVDGALEAGFGTDPSAIVTKDSGRARIGGELPVGKRPEPMPCGCWAY